jgi:hypothetical protein
MISPANKPAHDFTCLLREFRQPDSRAVYSWDDADRLRADFERPPERLTPRQPDRNPGSVRHRNMMRCLRRRRHDAGLNSHGRPHGGTGGRPATILIEYGGLQLTFSGWSRITGIGTQTLRDRLDKLGWPVEKALTVKLKTKVKMMIKINSDEVMELKLLRDQIIKNRKPGIAVGSKGQE